LDLSHSIHSWRRCPLPSASVMVLRSRARLCRARPLLISRCDIPDPQPFYKNWASRGRARRHICLPTNFSPSTVPNIRSIFPAGLATISFPLFLEGELFLYTPAGIFSLFAGTCGSVGVYYVRASWNALLVSFDPFSKNAGLSRRGLFPIFFLIMSRSLRCFSSFFPNGRPVRLMSLPTPRSAALPFL